MRDFKFRAWDNKKKEWLMGYEMPNLGGFSLFGECVLLGEWSAILDKFLFSREGYTPDDLKVMQFTGVKDVNGKEIYECDICVFYKDGPMARPLPIEFRDGAFVAATGEKSFIVLTSCRPPEFEFQVIGNLCENPELLSQRSESK